VHKDICWQGADFEFVEFLHSKRHCPRCHPERALASSAPQFAIAFAFAIAKLQKQMS